jgi:hypothetical protein
MQHDETKIEVITTDLYTGEGTEDLTIHIYNSLCGDSSYINLNDEEVRKLRDKLNDWLEE